MSEFGDPLALDPSILREAVERYRDPEGVRELEYRARLVRYCSHPIFLRRARSLRRTSTKISAADYKDRLARPCGSRIRTYCPSCAYLYFGDSLAMVRSGLLGGKGVPETVMRHPKVFLTLTAPSFGPVHGATGRCHPRGKKHCPHGNVLTCDVEHALNDPIVGAPLCQDCVDSVAQILFNASISRLWDRTLIELRRELSRLSGVAVRRGQDLVRLEYLRVVELQHRGAYHVHAVLRLDDAKDVNRDPIFGADDLVTCITRAIPRAKLRLRTGEEARIIKWGSQVDLQVIGEDAIDQVAGYLSKYLSKDIAVELDPAAKAQSPPHLVHLAQVASELARSRKYRAILSAHSVTQLGFGGHIMSASRRFSASRTALGRIRREYAIEKRQSRGEPIEPIFAQETSFAYDGRGWVSRGDAWLVKMGQDQLIEGFNVRREVSNE